MTKYRLKDFLLDDDFILWQLTGDSDLNAYWEDYIARNPASVESFQKAVREFSKIQFSREHLSDIEYHRLRQKIHTSVSHARKKKQLRHRILRYAAVACVVFAAGFSLYLLNTGTEKTGLQAGNIIVGENLDEKDIYLITGSGTTSFDKDIHVQIDEHGSAIVQEAGGGAITQVSTAKTAMNKMIVPYGKRSRLELPDGTKVWINSGSVLEFPSAFTENSRAVNLTGEMYIEVAKDDKKPFLVNTPDFQIKVYGTKFNVSAYHDERSVRSVVLVEGSVGVKTVLHGETVLQPNEMLTCNNNRMDKKQVDIIKYISWKDGYIVLEQTPISEVLKQVERFYNLSFNIRNVADLQSKTCTGKIYLSDNLDNVMNTISLLSSTKYTRDDKMIYIDVNPLK
jgi:ferric-dicitrate binding protein FerR (iron transport regulator)